jgi:hypothetical protein
MPKTDPFYTLGRILEDHPTAKTILQWALLTGALVYVCLCLADGAEIQSISAHPMNATEDLQYLLSNVYGFESWDIDERVVLVGVAWGYNVSMDGMVTLDDGSIYTL